MCCLSNHNAARLCFNDIMCLGHSNVPIPLPYKHTLPPDSVYVCVCVCVRVRVRVPLLLPGPQQTRPPRAHRVRAGSGAARRAAGGGHHGVTGVSQACPEALAQCGNSVSRAGARVAMPVARGKTLTASSVAELRNQLRKLNQSTRGSKEP